MGETVGEQLLYHGEWVPWRTTVPDRYIWRDKFGDHRSPIVAFRFGWSGDFPRHDHDFMEIHLCVEGEGTHVSAEGERPFRPGDFLILRPGVWHATRANKRQVSYVCCFGVQILHRELAWMMTDPLLNRLFWAGPLAKSAGGFLWSSLTSEGTARCAEHLDKLWRLGDEDLAEHRASRIAYFLLAVSELAKPISPGLVLPLARSSTPHPSVLGAIRLLESDLTEPWTRESLSASLRIDSSYLAKLFRTATGTTPMDFLARSRAERAASLLISTKLPVAEIGKRVGWPDPNHFSRRFRTHFGSSPTAYRHQSTTNGPTR